MVKAFATMDVLSCVTGRLMREGGMGGVYEVLNFMTGESLYTHQLPRVCREAVPVILATHPHLQQAIDEAEQINPGNFSQWAETWLDRYGPEISVPKMNQDQHERIDPISELSEKVHPDKIIVITPKDQPND